MADLIAKNCPVCFVDYAIPQSMASKMKRDGGNWHCPNGHSLHYTETGIDRVRQHRDRLVQDNARLEQEASAARERAATAERAQKRMVTRAKAGVCPCCNRTFQQLARHMANKHPTFTAEPAKVVPMRKRK